MTNDESTSDQRDPSESLRVQLSELNNRSRWYSSQLWQVPFAFLGLAGLLVGEVAEKFHAALPVAFLAVAVLGGFVLVHVRGLMEGERRAVKNLQKTEELLRIPGTAEYKPDLTVHPLYLLIKITVLAAIGIMIFLVWQRCT